MNGRRTSGRFLVAAVASVVLAAGVTAPEAAGVRAPLAAGVPAAQAAGVPAAQAAAGTGATAAERSTARLATMTEAPDTATGLAAAQMQHRAVPIAALTTPTRRVSAKPDGTMQAELSPVPAWVKQGNGWVNADPTLRRLADHTVTPAAAQLPMRLSGGGSAPMVTIGTPGRSFALSWPGVLPEPVLDGVKSTYPEVLPGVDLVLIADVGQLSQHLVVKTAAAARNPALRSIRLGVHLDGLTVRTTAGGALQALDPAGTVAFEAPPSTMWDTKGRTAKVGVAVGSGTVTLSPDRALLTDPHAAFPITVDPAWRTPDWEWAKVFSGKGSTSYWWGGQDIEQDGANWGKVGYCGFSGCNGIDTARTYFQFDTSFMNGKTLISAVFSAAIAYSPDCTHTPLHELWISNNTINGGLTWNNQPGATRVDWAAAGNEYPGCANGYQSIKFNVGAYYSPTNRSVYSIRASDEGDKNAWRKYDVSKTRLRFDYNTTPNAPAGLRTDPVLPAPCKWCGGIPYIHDDSIRLIGTLSDPDNDQLNPDWDVFSKQPSSTDDAGDVVNERGPALASGATFSRTLDLTGQDGKQLWWKLRGWDGLAGGARVTSDKTFAVDRTGIVTMPGVAGDLYTTNDNDWHGGIGVPGKFTFTPFAGSGTAPPDVQDIDHYVYDWHADPTAGAGVADADKLGGSAVAFIAPVKDGPQTLYVRSVDRAGNMSPTFQYHTYVRPGNGPVAHWPLDGNTSDTSALRGHDGTLNGTTTFTGGVDGQALTLGGNGYLAAPNAARTDTSFSVSAWVRIAARPAGTTGVQTAVAQEGTVNSGFMLSYRNDPAGDRWEFHLPSADKVARNADTVLRSAVFARPGEWAHLAGVYDAVTNKVSLYVNGEPAGSMPRSEGFNARGALELGRAMWEGNAAVNAWNGSIDEAQVFDRALNPADVQSIVRHADVAVDHFTFDDTSSGSTVHNSVAGGADGTLHGGAHLADHGAVHQALTLGGIVDYVSAPNAVRTDSSFAVSAWVRVAARPAGPNDAITALSQDGTSYSGFLLGYRNDPGGDRWEFHLPSADTTQRSADTLLRSSMVARAGVWTHLTGVYDAPANKVMLYVNGVLAGSTTRLGGFTATGEFKVGRGMWDGNNTVNPWNGSVDEVRVYNRTLSDAEVQGIVSRDAVTVGTWRLDGTLRDDSPRNVAAVPDGAVGYTAGQVSMPDPNDKALALTGTAQSTVSTPPAVDTDQSFSVAAWAWVDQVGGNQTVASQDGVNVSGFRFRQCGDRWCFVMFPKDVNTSVGAVEAVSSGTAQARKWTHLVAVYDAAAKKILIYVDGVVAGSAAYTSTWNAGGSFHLGAAGPGLGEFLTGAIDDVLVYSRALTAGEIPALSGRDVSLVHKYTFEEGSGSNSADAAGGRPATLNPGATFTPQGQIGGALNLNGTSGSATTTGVDLGTDHAFTVSAWVYLSSKPCDLSDPANVCRADAVTIDGAKTSKFRLGHVIDGDNHTDGAWVFEMPESDAVDAQVTKAAVSTLSSELDRWTLLTGVYDPAQKQLWIYVDGTRVGAGVLLNAWPSNGPLVIGRGKAAGQAAEYWPGRVDDVLLYNVAMTTDQVSALRDSYQK